MSSKPSVSARTQRERAVRSIYADAEREAAAARAAIFDRAIKRLGSVNPHGRAETVVRRFDAIFGRRHYR